MSLSTMNKAAYRQHRRSIRDNGSRYTLPRIECPLEREDMSYLVRQDMFSDWLAERAWFQRFDPAPVAFRATSWTTLRSAT